MICCLRKLTDTSTADPILTIDNSSTKDNAGQCVLSIAEAFQVWMAGIDHTTRNDNIRYLANYWHDIMSMFTIYVRAQRCGESVLMESIENQFCAENIHRTEGSDPRFDGFVASGNGFNFFQDLEKV